MSLGLETPCPARKDGLHCNCWYDGDGCCSCGNDPDHGPGCDCDRTEKHPSDLEAA